MSLALFSFVLLLFLRLMGAFLLHLHVLLVHVHVHVVLLVHNEALLCHLHLHFVHFVLLDLVNLLFGDHRDWGHCLHILFMLLHLVSDLCDHHLTLPAMRQAFELCVQRHGWFLCEWSGVILVSAKEGGCIAQADRRGLRNIALGRLNRCVNLRVAKLDHAVQVLEGLLLSILCFTELLHEVLLNALKLPHFVDHRVYVLLSRLLLLSILDRNALLVLSLWQGLVLNELALVLPDLKGSIALIFKVRVTHEHTFVVAFFLLFDNLLLDSLIHSQYVYVVAALLLDSDLVLSQIA